MKLTPDHSAILKRLGLGDRLGPFTFCRRATYGWNGQASDEANGDLVREMIRGKVLKVICESGCIRVVVNPEWRDAS